MKKSLLLSIGLFVPFCLSLKLVNTKEKNAEELKEEPLLKKSIILESGIYNIPFGATTDEVLKWCTANNMTITSPTEKDVKESAKKSFKRIRDIKEEYDFEEASLIHLEQELLKLAKGYAIAGDIFELAKVAAAQEILSILKNPTVSYEGQRYYLEVVNKGIKVDVDGEQRICTEDVITKTVYKLVLKPTDKSERMLQNGLQNLFVFFYGDIGEDIKTYATLGLFLNTQFDLIFTAVRDKYGNPKFIPPWRSDNGYAQSYEDILCDINELFGIGFDITFFGENSAVVWSHNLILLGDLQKVAEPIGVALDGTEYLLLYYEHKTANHIRELHTKAIDDFEKKCREKKQEDLSQAQKDF